MKLLWIFQGAQEEARWVAGGMLSGVVMAEVPRPPTSFIQPPCRAAPHTSHPQDDLPCHLPGGMRNFAEQLFGMVFPGEGGGEVQVVADPTRIQLNAVRYR